MNEPLSFAATDAGTVRTRNEDAFVDLPERGLWAVADGAGGHAAGDLASGLLREALLSLPAGLEPEETMAQLRLAVLAVHSSLRAEALRRGDAMIASTLAVLLLRFPYFAALWSGDSRVYLLRHGELVRVTRDHTLVQILVDEGMIAEEAAEHHPQANVVTRAIGAADDDGELDKTIGTAQPGDHFLLCSDGLTKTLAERDLPALIAGPAPAAALTAASLARGATDNVTAVVVRLPPDPP